MSEHAPCPACADTVNPAEILAGMIACGYCAAPLPPADYIPLVFNEGQPFALQHGCAEPVIGCTCPDGAHDAAAPCPVCAALIAAHPEYSQPR